MAFTTGSCPFGVFENDPAFQLDADRLVTFVSRKLGESFVQVELSSSDVYTCFEEACLDYSAMVNMYQAKSALTTFLGSPTGTLNGSQNRYPGFSLEWQRRQAMAYNDAADLNGNKPLYKGQISLRSGVQQYDLQAAMNPTGSDGMPQRIVIKDIFHFSPISPFRFFGASSAINYLNAQFNFESYTPETIFYLLPVWEDVLRGMEFKMSNRVRRSNYSYDLNNNVLSLYPAPAQDLNMFFTYQLAGDGIFGPLETSAFNASGSIAGTGAGTNYDGVANLSNIPFGNIEYSKLNSISRTWIWKMTLALSKEVMGHIRRKMNTIPIPNGDLTLDGNDLVNDARTEIDTLKAELKEILDSTTYDRLAVKEAEQADALERAQSKVPLKIYIGAFLPFMYWISKWLSV